MHETQAGVRPIPRDSTGAYSLPSGTLVNTGDTIEVNQHNPPFQDIAQSLGNSLDRDGKGGMRADLPMGGNKITNLADGVDPSDAATVGQLSSGGVVVPIGAVLDYWGASPPTGWLFAAGQEISRSEYAPLFAVIGTAGGVGNGSTTFNLPDYRGRVGAGRDNMALPSAARLNTLSSTTLGATGGAQTHTLVTGEMPAHSHTVTDPGHSHSISDMPDGTFTSDGGGFGSIPNFAGGSTNSATTGITLANTGGGGAHNNVQPSIIANKIIKVTA